MSQTTTNPPTNGAPAAHIFDRHRNSETAAQPARQPARSITVAPEASLPTISVGFDNLQSWEFTQRVARALAASSMVPVAYRSHVKKGYGQNETWEENPNGIPNCIVALNMARNMRMDALMVMQNLDIIEGRPAWRASFLAGLINGSGRYGQLQYDFKDRGEITVVYQVSEWVENDRGKRHKVSTEKKATVRDMICVAWAIDKASGARLESPPVTMRMAVEEGWYGKDGSKWKTMPELMIRYRAASFFSRIYASDLTLGHRTDDEEREILEAQYNVTAGHYETVEAEARIAADTGPAARGESNQSATSEAASETASETASEQDGQPDAETDGTDAGNEGNGDAAESDKAAAAAAQAADAKAAAAKEERAATVKADPKPKQKAAAAAAKPDASADMFGSVE